jgi:hypothetical protein
MNERRRWRHRHEIAIDEAALAAIEGEETPEDLVIAFDERAKLFAALHERFARDVVGAQIVRLFDGGRLTCSHQEGMFRSPRETRPVIIRSSPRSWRASFFCEA